MFILHRDHLKRCVSKLLSHFIHLHLIQNGIVFNFDCFLKSPYFKKKYIVLFEKFNFT